MASENFPHSDERRPTNYCSTLVVVVFITFSIFAMWKFQSSPTILVQNSELPYQENDGFGQKVTDRSSGNTKSQDAINDEKKITERESGDAVRKAKSDSAAAVEADQKEKILDKSTDGTTSLEKTSEMELGSENGTDDEQNNDDHEKGQTREEKSTEVRDGDAVKDTKADSADAVEADQKEKILDKSADGTTSSEKTSEIEFGSENGTNDKQNNDDHEKGQTRKEQSTELRNGDAVKETKDDSVDTVEADQKEKILDKSTDGTTSSENASEMEFGSENGTDDKQNNDDHEKGQTREEVSTEVHNEDTDEGSGGQATANKESESNNNTNSSNGNNSDLDATEKTANAEGGSDEVKQEDRVAGPTSKSIEQNLYNNSKENDRANDVEIQKVDQLSDDRSETFNETTAQDGSFSTQVVESQNEKSSQQDFGSDWQPEYSWKVCNTTTGPDYIPCLDNVFAVRRLHSTMHFEHRERHCPDEAPTCLVPLPAGYKKPVLWPTSREKIWFNNVPHTKLAVVKERQNWVRVAGEYITFPGGGTQFIHGALRYIDGIQEANPAIAWGKRTRVILDVGCGVASFGGYLFERDVLAMSFAPKDEHEAQVQFAIERGIPAIIAVMGTKRLPFPGGVFDAIHCARCRVPWHVEEGRLLLELNRVLRPGGYFIWSATPIYRKDPENVGIWKEMSRLTKAMCWDLVLIRKDKLNKVAIALYRKPSSNDCYENRPLNKPPLCNESDDPNLAWNVTLQACMHKVPANLSERGSQWPEQWPKRLAEPPYWLNSKFGEQGKPAQEDFTADYNHWKDIVARSYLNEIGVSWSSIRNVMDMRAVYGGFAAALRDLKVWVMNVIPIDSPDTLPIIYERGLFGLYHDWCESFNTYPRSYDLLHADNLFSSIKRRCKLLPVFAEVDRILRPDGILIVRDDWETIAQIKSMAKSMRWEVRSNSSKESEGLLCVQKIFWRPVGVETIIKAIA